MLTDEAGLSTVRSAPSSSTPDPASSATPAPTDPTPMAPPCIPAPFNLVLDTSGL
ncbi:hypothetical protein TPA0598_03_07430 [Streptomyces lydicamycinicus]|uniref:Uncharacterized protein n=1 Tax=Streptomyces lydicamycinicus TaxID=1546107 RepID=A0A0P4R5W1_9ACTN|nr:hypothetical protein TPA0598_03_07430 [Streptomyces lydicamycinicus]